MCKFLHCSVCSMNSSLFVFKIQSTRNREEDGDNMISVVSYDKHSIEFLSRKRLGDLK